MRPAHLLHDLTGLLDLARNLLLFSDLVPLVGFSAPLCALRILDRVCIFLVAVLSNLYIFKLVLYSFDVPDFCGTCLCSAHLATSIVCPVGVALYSIHCL